MSALDNINLNGTRYNLAVPTAEMTQKAVNEWLDDHPEATTTVEDGAITKDKLNDPLKRQIDGHNFIDMKFYNYRTFKNRTVFTVDSNHVMQGGTMHNGKVIMLCPKTDETDCYIVEVTDETVTNRQLLTNAGHANDMTYCNRDNRFYIATSGSVVATVDADTLTEGTPITVGHDITAILWDNVNEWFYCVNGQVYYKYAYDWTLIETGDVLFRKNGFGGSLTGQNGQSSFLIGDYYGWVTNYVSDDIYMRNVFIIFDPITQDVIASFNFPAQRGDDEVQFAAYDDGVLYAFSGNYNIRFYRAYVDRAAGNGIRDNVVLLDTTGTKLTEGADVKQILRPGLFYADSRKETPITGAPGYYTNGDAEFMQIPFGLHDVLGLFASDARVSMLVNNAYHTLLTHKDLEYVNLGNSMYYFTFMKTIRLVFGTRKITCDNSLSIPITFSDFTPAFAVGAPVVGYTSDTSQVVYGYRGYSNGALNYKGGDASIVSAERQCRFIALFFFNMGSPTYYE